MSTQEQKDERRARFRSLCREIAGMSEVDRAKLAARMPVVTVEGHALSGVNTGLVCLQAGSMPVTIVGGYRQWREKGRQVKKGEHGLMIWVPVRSKRRDEAAEVPVDGSEEPQGFLVGYVFDVSQTEEVQQ